MLADNQTHPHIIITEQARMEMIYGNKHAASWTPTIPPLKKCQPQICKILKSD